MQVVAVRFSAHQCRSAQSLADLPAVLQCIVGAHTLADRFVVCLVDFPDAEAAARDTVANVLYNATAGAWPVVTAVEQVVEVRRAPAASP